MRNLLAKNIIRYRDESYGKIYYLLCGNMEKYWQTDLRGIRSWQTVIKVALQLEYSYPALACPALVLSYKIICENGKIHASNSFLSLL